MDYARWEMNRLEHSHGKDDWHQMEEVHDSAPLDQEREWSSHRIFKCATCEAEIRIAAPEPREP
jgi:hypothetical protein